MKVVRNSLILFIIASACAASPVGPTLLAIPEPVAPLAEEYVEIVAFEALWKCDIQRYALDDLGTIETKLTARLTESGFSGDEYEDFKAALDRDNDLRLHTRLAFRKVCSDVGS